MSRLALESGAVYIYSWTARCFPFNDEGGLALMRDGSLSRDDSRGSSSSGRHFATAMLTSTSSARQSRHSQTFHLELFSELQFLVFVALPYIIPAVNGNRKFRRDNRRHSRGRSDRSSLPSPRFLAPPMRFLWETWSREILRANNTAVAFNHLSTNYIKFIRGLKKL